MATKYIRVVLAFEEEDEDLVRETLDHYIEADQYNGDDNGVSGAYVSMAYPDRSSALGKDWQDAETRRLTPYRGYTIIEYDITGPMYSIYAGGGTSLLYIDEAPTLIDARRLIDNWIIAR